LCNILRDRNHRTFTQRRFIQRATTTSLVIYQICWRSLPTTQAATVRSIWSLSTTENMECWKTDSGTVWSEKSYAGFALQLCYDIFVMWSFVMSVCCVREVKRKVGPDSNLVHKKADIAFHGNPTSQLRDVTCHMGSHRINLLPDTSERAPPNPNHAGWCSIYLPQRDGRLSWPSWLNSAPARSRTTDLSITSPMPNRTAAPPNDNRNQSCQSYTKVLVFSRSYCCTQ